MEFPTEEMTRMQAELDEYLAGNPDVYAKLLFAGFASDGQIPPTYAAQRKSGGLIVSASSLAELRSKLEG